MTVYFSTQLQRLYPRIAFECLETLCANKIDVSFIETGENVWLRDWMPVKTVAGMTAFRYRTVGWNKYSQLKAPEPVVKRFRDYWSEIILDGGNVVQSKSHVIMTDKVLRQNRRLGAKAMRTELEELFLGKQITFIPGEPDDDLCHADGIVHFISDQRAFVNDYCQKDRAYANYQEKVCDILSKAGIEPVLLPNAHYQCPQMSEAQFRKKYPQADDYNPGVGYYVNMLTVSNVVLLPIFHVAEDAAVIKIVEREFSEHAVKPISCFNLAMCGGLLNCVSWEN